MGFLWASRSAGRGAASQSNHPRESGSRSLLGFHGLTKTVGKCNFTESVFGIEDVDRQHRYAVTVADGAVEGPYGIGVGLESAGRSGVFAPLPWGSLDDAHALDKAGHAADKSDDVAEYVHYFHSAARAARKCFHFGNGKVVVRSVTRKYGLHWRSPHAPHSNAIRMVLYESLRCPPMFFEQVASSSRSFEIPGT